MDKEILEGNRVIAEFMGWRFEILPNEFGGELIAYLNNKVMWRGEKPSYLDKIMLTGYCFHSDWNKLMEVVEKIQSIDITPPPNYKGYRIEIVVQGYVKIEGSPMPPIFTNVSGAGSLIKAVWLAVVQFIKWYNTNSLTTKQTEQ